MCILAVKPIGHKMTERNISLLKIGVLKNPDGYGFYSYNTSTKEEETYHSFNEKEFIQKVIERGGAEYNLVYHARIKTAGDMTLSNLHPFDTANGWKLFQNGTTYGLDFDKEHSDTSVLASMANGFLKGTKDSIDAFCALFESIEKSRLVFAKRKDVVYANEQDGTWDEGIWYSNDRIFKKPVFVYGTLKKGFSNERVYTGFGYFSAHTRYRYPLIDNGLPMMFNEKGEGHHVSGEVILVDDKNMPAIDKLEGHPDLYKREKINVIIKKGGFDMDVEAYMMQGAMPGDPHIKEYKEKRVDRTFTNNRGSYYNHYNDRHTDVRNRMRSSSGYGQPSFFHEMDAEDGYGSEGYVSAHDNDNVDTPESQMEDQYVVIIRDNLGHPVEMTRADLLNEVIADLEAGYQSGAIDEAQLSAASDWYMGKYSNTTLIEFAKACDYEQISIKPV